MNTQGERQDSFLRQAAGSAAAVFSDPVGAFAVIGFATGQTLVEVCCISRLMTEKGRMNTIVLRRWPLGGMATCGFSGPDAFDVDGGWYDSGELSLVAPNLPNIDAAIRAAFRMAPVTTAALRGFVVFFIAGLLPLLL